MSDLAKIPPEAGRIPVVCASLPVSDLAKGDRRMEGEAYLTGGYAIQHAIERGQTPFARLSTLARIWMPGRLKGIQVGAAHGVPFFTATQLFDLSPVPRKWLAPSHTRDMTERLVEPGWVLVACSGTDNVGDVTMSHATHQGAIVSHDLLRLRVNADADAEYLYAFLRGRYGYWMLRSSQYGSIIKHIEPEHLFGLPVPWPAAKSRRTLGGGIKDAFSHRDEAYRLIRAAESRYAAELGVQPAESPDEAGYSVPSSELSDRRRLDGYFHNPAAQTAHAALKRSNRPFQPLSSAVDRLFGVPRFKHIYTREGTPYLDSEDIFKINPKVVKHIPAHGEGDGRRLRLEKYFVRRGWLLMACSGQLYGINGNVQLADSWHENKVISNHVMRIVPSAAKDAPPAGYLHTVLNHPTLGRPLVLRCASGTSVPEIAPDDLGRFPLPRLTLAAEVAISEMVVEASRLRMLADRLENEAVARVDAAVAQMLGGIVPTEVAEPVTREVPGASKKRKA